MSRFSIETSLNNVASQGPVSNGGYWPTLFPNETIGIERSGVIINDGNILTPDDVIPIPGALEAIRMMRLKGYKVVIFFNEPLISQGLMTPYNVDLTNQRLMELFGQAGIQTIEGLLYSTTSMKQDIFSMPNTGMMKKAEVDFRVKFKGGYFVGDKLYNLKAGLSSGARPILIKSGQFNNTAEKLETFANRDLKKNTKVFNSLLEFSNSLL